MYFNRPVDHINLTVPNLQKAVDFYTNTLGFKIVEKYMGKKEFVFITDGSNTYELFEDSTLDKTLIEHIAYVSHDIETDYNHFSSLGLTTTPIGKADFLFQNGADYFFITGATGDKIEFIHRR